MLSRLIKVDTNGTIVFFLHAESHSIVKLPCIDFKNVVKLKEARSNLGKHFSDSLVSPSALEDIYS